MTEGPYKLPEGWRWVRLGEVCRPTERRDPTKEPGSTFLYVDISAVDNASGEIVAVKEVLGKDAPSRARKGIRADDVIFATTRPYLKNIAIVPPELDGQICSTGFCVLRADKVIIDPRFLFYVCRSDMFVEQLSQGNMRGASYPAVTDKDVFNSIIPLPPLEEQRRIVARIEELMGRVREARRLRQEAQKDAERLWQSVLAETFPRPGSELPEGWRWVRLGEIIRSVESGKRPKGGVKGIANGIPSIGGEHLTWDGRFDFSNLRYVSPEFYRSLRKGKIIQGDVLIVKDGATTGKTAYVSEKFPFKAVCVNEHVYILRVRENMSNSRYVFLFLVSPAGQKQIRGTFHGAAQGGINSKFVDQVLFPLPPLSEQRRIVAHLEAVQEKIRALKSAQSETDEDLNRLEQAILDKAFRGEL